MEDFATLRALIREVINAYKILGVGPNPTDAEVNVAWRKKARELHPDLNRDRDTTRDMSDLNVARDTFIDKSLTRRGMTRKQEMDLELAREQRPKTNPYQDFVKRPERDYASGYTAKQQHDADERRRRATADDEVKRRHAEREAREREEMKRDVSARSWEKAYDGDVVLNQRFTFVGGNSSKFWSVKVEINRNVIAPYIVTVTFGRIGSPGRIDRKEFLMAGAAKRFVDGKIFEKLNEGYQEVMDRPEERPRSSNQGNPNPEPSKAQTSTSGHHGKDTYKVYGKRVFDQDRLEATSFERMTTSKSVHFTGYHWIENSVECHQLMLAWKNKTLDARGLFVSDDINTWSPGCNFVVKMQISLTNPFVIQNDEFGLEYWITKKLPTKIKSEGYDSFVSVPTKLSLAQRQALLFDPNSQIKNVQYADARSTNVLHWLETYKRSRR